MNAETQTTQAAPAGQIQVDPAEMERQAMRALSTVQSCLAMFGQMIDTLRKEIAQLQAVSAKPGVDVEPKKS